ncbi:MAG: hypothetical protein WCF90_02070 [Methanomicrobiales archaeon]
MLLCEYTMPTTQSSETCIAIMTPRKEHIFPATSRIPPAGDGLSPFPGATNAEVLNQFGELFRETDIEISDDEINELRIFDDFLARHVQPSRICDVQCMLLWNEWVRTYRRQTPDFPKLIREKEFRMVITDKFGTGIAHKGFRGPIYTGIRFVS